MATVCLQVVQRYVDPYQRTTSMVITPTVVKEVRAQFGCNTLPGAALENEGGQGSANAHWEYRWFQVGHTQATIPTAALAWGGQLCTASSGTTMLRLLFAV